MVGLPINMMHIAEEMRNEYRSSVNSYYGMDCRIFFSVHVLCKICRYGV